MTHITYHCHSVHNDGPDHFRLYLNCRFECLLIVLLNYSTTIRDLTDMSTNKIKRLWLDFSTNRNEIYTQFLFRTKGTFINLRPEIFLTSYFVSIEDFFSVLSENDNRLD